jgi:undecaprenyl-diphosphatase
MEKDSTTTTNLVRRLPVILLVLLLPQLCAGQNLDMQLLNSWHVHRNTSLDGTMNVLGATIYPVAAAIPVAQFIYGLAKNDPKSIENRLQTAATLVVTAASTYGLKYIIRRERPYVAHPEYKPYEYDGSPSFPSGHTSFAFATATNLSMEYPRWYVIVPSYLYAGAIGYSRIHLGAHYPSDVLAGAIVGAASAYVTYKGKQWLKGHWKKKPQERLLD